MAVTSHDLSAVLSTILFAGGDPWTINPERPTVSNTAKTMPFRGVELGLGVDAQVHGLARSDEFRVSVPLTVRIGLHDRVELRLFDGDPWRWINAHTSARQRGDLTVSLKLRLAEREGRTRVTVSLQPSLTPMPPFGGAEFWAPLPGLLLLTTLERGDWNFDLNLGPRLKPDQGRCCGASNFLALAASRGFLDDRLRVWAEAYLRLDLPTFRIGELAGDVGLYVTVARRVAFDAGVLVGAAERTFVVTVLGGMSVLWGP